MPKRKDIKKILVVGAGPIIIGQACEFDYSGTQACKALKDEGYKVILINSNPATIMTDPGVADKTYVEPITIDILEKILILDTETTGLDENKDEVIEIGCILFDVSFKCVLSQVSFLFPVNNNEAEHVNGISAEVTNISQPWEDGLNFFLKLVDCSDFIVAHNVEFDRKWFWKGRLPKLDKYWICSLEDINWSFQKSLKSRPSVTDLALSFSIPVWNLHRALSDCFYISEV